jgi:hypothetical protein
VASREYGNEPLDSIKDGKFLGSLVTISFSRMTRHRLVSVSLKIKHVNSSFQ